MVHVLTLALPRIGIGFKEDHIHSPNYRGRRDGALARTLPCSATTPTLQNRSSPPPLSPMSPTCMRVRARVVGAVRGESSVWATHRTGERSANFTAGVNDKP